MSKPDQMDRVRAAREILPKHGPHKSDAELVAFMAIFHPEYSAAKVAEMKDKPKPLTQKELARLRALQRKWATQRVTAKEIDECRSLERRQDEADK